jgi:hypothetical protein
MRINYKQNKLFSNLSKDYNQIHLSKKFALKFFVKEPIVHGINLVIFALSEFLKKKKDEIVITNISLNFKNFVSVNEEFSYLIFKKKIIIFNEFHNKLEIFIDYEILNKKNTNSFKAKPLKNTFYKSKFNKLKNSDLINQLIYISYYIGSVKPGNGALILNVKLNFNNKYLSNIKPFVEKKVKNIYVIRFQDNCYNAQIIACKLLSYKKQLKKLKFRSSMLRKLQGKKILVFGLSSDLGERFNNEFIKKSGCVLLSHSYRINSEKPSISKKQKITLEKKILKIKPDYIFYFSSPKIFYDEKKNKKLYYYYKAIFVDYFKFLVKLIIKNKIKSKIFYPSTFFLNEKKKYSRYQSYISTKEIAEKFCKSKKNKKIITCARLPKLMSRSNYNLLGYYEGENIKVLDNYFKKFF